VLLYKDLNAKIIKGVKTLENALAYYLLALQCTAKVSNTTALNKFVTIFSLFFGPFPFREGALAPFECHDGA